MTQFLDFGLKIAKTAGKQLIILFNKNTLTSRNPSIKTQADKEIDKLIISKIKNKFKDHSILTEETGLVKNKSDYLWIIDPIDGTGNFINHNPFFSISIALYHKGEPVFGIIEAPLLNERYLAVKDKGAYLINLKTKKKKKVHVSKVKELSKSQFLFCGGHTAHNKGMLNIMKQFYPKVENIRKLGSGAIECAWVGTGRAEAFILPQAYIWDIAAGVIFVSEAGGRVVDFTGNEYTYQEMIKTRKLSIVAFNNSLKLPKQVNY